MNREQFHERCRNREDLYHQKKFLTDIMKDCDHRYTAEAAHMKYPILMKVIQQNEYIKNAVFDELAELSIKAQNDFEKAERSLGITEVV